MSSELRNAVLLYRVISVIFQTFAYGIYLCLIPISIYVMRAKGLRARSRQFLFVMTMFMFALSTLYWILSLAVTFLVFRAWFSNLDPNTHQPPNWLPMFSAIVLLNYILTDGVVVWRAWVLCPDQSKAILMVPVVTLVINMLIYLTMISVRAALYVVPEGVPSHHSLARAIDIAKLGHSDSR
ncbi:hypothetical protein B0F90DRAFT_1094489 [Multifurca ochricompacta]|uniref:Uncharacterized protein n=1 Tax=Multifurca ochricompacta TaxID=376703 RepID=A0AAD4M8T8_9AGAM|nr:hypothetical protein B0F90DRAFT_1094489 [Multifurca ochricompacta]